ncbi:MAG TPA: alpha-amylase family glycosyl hydrolase [Dehalococcoidia bacterium]|nr:alpha-amylase family glycosyl hydrolase [Dehalococcoidia bacterium]
MTQWPGNPTIYEINTWVWLGDLSRRYSRPITLDSVPDEEWDALAGLDFDAVWLMGVWERSPLGRQIAAETPELVAEFRRVLPDYTDEDNVGSPYCVHRYRVDPDLGGPTGLALARRALASRGMKLVLDYVPNHVALDHPVTSEHPEFFIRGDESDLEQDPNGFFKVEDKVIARGRDPNFPPWPDVAQLNAYSPDLRRWVIDTVSSIADQCDGMRCDMAMLMMTDIFRRTWGNRGGEAPSTEFWPEVIGAVKRRNPDVVFFAEAYWDLEYDLQQQGFDYCYDKRLYDRLAHEDAESVRGHLRAALDYQTRLLRFTENHDEPRAAATFIPAGKERAAAIFATTLPGARLLHQGQLSGKRTRIPVFLRRGPEEPADQSHMQAYRSLLRGIKACGGLRDDWSLCNVRGWPDNQSCRNLTAWAWSKGDTLTALIIVNYADTRSQGIVELPPGSTGDRTWWLADMFSAETFTRDGHQMIEQGMYVELEAWGIHFLQATPMTNSGLVESIATAA